MKNIYVRFLPSILLISTICFHFSPVLANDFDHNLLQKFLDRHIVTGQEVDGFHLTLVDYQAIYRDRSAPEALYDQVLRQFSTFDPAKLTSRNEKLAFWVNAYNFGAIKMIVDHFPVDSIRSRKINFLKNPWNKKVLSVGGQNYSLGQIEHDILLDELSEPMTHFAIVCASLSCPNLSPDIYTHDKLDSQLARQASLFLQDPKKGVDIDREGKTVYFSQIFRFDKKTFPDGARSALELISPYLSRQQRTYLADQEYKIKYLDYNWDLNITKANN
jgi:hypothetical protein